MKRARPDWMHETIARPGVRRRRFSGERATIAFTAVEPGQEPGPRSELVVAPARGVWGTT